MAATIKKALHAAQKRWGQKVRVGHNPKAPDKAQKEALRELRALQVEKLEALRKEIKEAGDLEERLLLAAEGCIDSAFGEQERVNLIAATATVRGLMVKREQVKAVYKEERRLQGLILSYRYDVHEDQDMGFAVRHILVQADSLDELLDKIALEVKTA